MEGAIETSNSTATLTKTDASPSIQNTQINTRYGIGRKGHGLDAFTIAGDEEEKIQDLITKTDGVPKKPVSKKESITYVGIGGAGQGKNAFTLETTQNIAEIIAKENDIPIEKVTILQISQWQQAHTGK